MLKGVVRVGELDEPCEVVGLNGGFLSIRCKHPFAPGQPVSLSIAIGEHSVRVEGRSQGSKRQDDGVFNIDLRPVNLRRQVRESLELALR